MKILLALVLSTLAGTAQSADMLRVAEGIGFCAGKEDSICYEWKLATAPNTRFVACGYEDGVDYSFCELQGATYKHLVRVYPALRDASRPGGLFWGYPWDLSDIALASDKRRMLATFEHKVFDDGNVESPSWQKRVPIVLFIGKTTQPQITVPIQQFEPFLLEALASQAGG